MNILDLGDIASAAVAGAPGPASTASNQQARVARPVRGEPRDRPVDSPGAGVAIVKLAVLAAIALGAVWFAYSDFLRDAIAYIGNPENLAGLKDTLQKSTRPHGSGPRTLGDAAESTLASARLIIWVVSALGSPFVLLFVLRMPGLIASIPNRAARLACALTAVTAAFGFALMAVETLGIAA